MLSMHHECLDAGSHIHAESEPSILDSVGNATKVDDGCSHTWHSMEITHI